MKSDLPLFYVPRLSDTLTMGEEESKHLARVLRLSPGDAIMVTDGEGQMWNAVLTDVSPKASGFSLINEVPQSTVILPPLYLAVAPTKNIDRIEWMLEKMVEVGLEGLFILYTDRTVRRQVNLTRLEKIMISALKQSRKRRITSIIECDGIEALFEHLSSLSTLSSYIGYCSDEYPRRSIKEVFVPAVPSLFLIGPEGDFTPDEVRLTTQRGAIPVTLGEERLRTETAALYSGILHSVLNS